MSAHGLPLRDLEILRQRGLTPEQEKEWRVAPWGDAYQIHHFFNVADCGSLRNTAGKTWQQLSVADAKEWLLRDIFGDLT